MSAPTRMHADEFETDADLVRRLLAAQQPQWADLPIERVASSGTDNAIYRLGSELAARLPRRPGARDQVHKECEWLPRLAPHLPLALPVPLAKGEPGDDYPSHWYVVPWLDGENPPPERLADPHAAAVALARFVAALQRIDTAGGSRPGASNFYLGVPLVLRGGYTRKALAALEGDLDTRAASAAWDEALAAPAWPGPPVWIHGDLTWVNLLASEGRISGVIDFG